MASAISDNFGAGDSTLHETCHELGRPDCADREARLQVFCESFWHRLDHSPRPHDSLISGFTSLLDSDDDLALVQLVVLDLRPAAPVPTNTLKRDLVRHFQSRRPLFELPNSRTRTTEAYHQFEEEKKILQEAELYRASILLCGHGNTSEAHKERMRKWLLEFPKEEA